VWAAQVDLPPGETELVGPAPCGGQVTGANCTRLFLEERDMERRGILPVLEERVLPDDLGELLACPDDDPHVEVERLADLILDRPRERRRALPRAPEDDVPALHVGAHVL